MKLRCCLCGRQENKVTLSDSFQCIDIADCKTFIAGKNRERQVVCIFGDAAALGTPKQGGQPMGIGIFTTIDGIHSEAYSGTKALDWGTVPLAEWIALRYALSVALIMNKENPNRVFKIFGDNQTVMRCFNNEYKTGINYKQQYIKADTLRIQLGVSLLLAAWIPREYNQEADKLSKQALLVYEQ